MRGKSGELHELLATEAMRAGRFRRMAVLPDITDAALLLRDGIWCRPDEQPFERWSAEAAADPIHAAIAATGTEAERAKSASDIEFLLDRAVDGIVLDLGCGYGRVAKYLLPRTRL